MDETLPPFSTTVSGFSAVPTRSSTTVVVFKNQVFSSRAFWFLVRRVSLSFRSTAFTCLAATNLRLVEYYENGHRFNFREIVFKSAGFDSDLLELKPEEIDVENDDVIISKANPQKCLNCHGRNASPMWEVYPDWPGVYGGNDDRLYLNFHRKEDEAKRIWNFLRLLISRQVCFRGFDLKPGFKDKEVLKHDSLSRSRSPITLATNGCLSVLAMRLIFVGARANHFSNLDQSAQCDEIRERWQTNGFWPSRPNLFYQDLLIRLNQDRIVAALTAEKVSRERFGKPNLGKDGYII